MCAPAKPRLATGANAVFVNNSALLRLLHATRPVIRHQFEHFRTCCVLLSAVVLLQPTPLQVNAPGVAAVRATPP